MKISIISIIIIGFLISALIYIIYQIGIEYSMATTNRSLHKLRYPQYYDIDFPEDAYPPKQNVQEYWERVEKGYKVCKEKRVVICGLVKDCAENLKMNLKRLTKMGNLFKECKFVVFENDSKDGTRELVKSYINIDPRFELVTCKESPDCILKQLGAKDHGMCNESRVNKMAKYRNRLLDWIKPRYSDYDFLLMQDMDLGGPISLNGLAHSFSYDDFDAITANGVASKPFSHGTDLWYHDWYALLEWGMRPRQWPFEECIKYTFLKQFRRGEPLFHVQSGFGGCAIYPMNKIMGRNIRYKGLFCEHIMLHQNMIEKGMKKIYVNPNFMILHSLEFPKLDVETISKLIKVK